MASILKVDKIRVTGSDSDSISFDGTGNITFSKTISGDNNHMARVFHNTWSTDVGQVLANNIFTTDFLHYKIFTRTRGDANHQLGMRLTTGGDSPADMSCAVYTGEWGNRAASATVFGTATNGTGSQLYMPHNHAFYAEADLFCEVTLMNARTGSVSGTTNISPARKRSGFLHWTGQTTNAADFHGMNGWFTFWNSTSSDNPVATGLKIYPSGGNFAEGEISVYGIKVT
tara:strand:- start:1141 stop:1827 length:687 start_codon:yes stop_codon:yes gene_type:complete